MKLKFGRYRLEMSVKKVFLKFTPKEVKNGERGKNRKSSVAGTAEAMFMKLDQQFYCKKQ